ncbi:YesK family protein [Oceanobacillus longus]|uniref:YesK family protein n=1 Tax=Oceanobacillus longus TaxID=930120 RepID=A0ABV8H3K7_9BACI
MDALMLEGWTPILLIGIAIAIIIFFVSRKISRKALILISIVLSLVCVGIVIYSLVVVRGWEGIGLLFVTFSGFVGIWIGTISGFIFKGK